MARVTWSLIAEPSDPVALLARERCGPVGALDLARRAGAADAARALGGGRPSAGETARAQAALERWRARLDAVEPERVLDMAAQRGIRVLVPGDDTWPTGLDDLGSTAPHCLWVHGPGDAARLAASRGGGAPLRSAGHPSPGGERSDPPGGCELAIALVGSRASTPYGEDTAGSIAAALAARGACIVSGGAYGIDAAAHRGALSVPDGASIAVLAGGADCLYPRGNTRLLEAIRERCLILTEAPPGTTPTRWRFLARNRLIAAMSQATAVIEASWRSGALSTARHADDLSRPVGAVPGPVTSAASAGCHRLIRERGAVLLTEAADVIDLVRGGEAAGESSFAVQDELDLLEPQDRRVLDGVPPRSLISETGLSLECALDPAVIAAALARLELFGLIERRGSGVRRVRPGGDRGMGARGTGDQSTGARSRGTGGGTLAP